MIFSSACLQLHGASGAQNPGDTKMTKYTSKRSANVSHFLISFFDLSIKSKVQKNNSYDSWYQIYRKKTK